VLPLRSSTVSVSAKSLFTRNSTRNLARLFNGNGAHFVCMIYRAFGPRVRSPGPETHAFHPICHSTVPKHMPRSKGWFQQEIFSNSTAIVHACIPEALAKMKGVKNLDIGYTKDIGLAETIARILGANQLVTQMCPEGRTLNLNGDE